MSTRYLATALYTFEVGSYDRRMKYTIEALKLTNEAQKPNSLAGY